MEHYVVKSELSETVEEAYNVLRANIHFCESSKKIKTLAVTSYSPGEGKSTTSINLGISMAKTGLEILFVDADLRKPMALKQLTSLNFNGLSNYLMGLVALEDIINKTNIPGFSFITCGIRQSNPSELITSEQFSIFLNLVKERYDMVIIDMPPMSSVIDSAIIAAQTDGIIIVFESGAIRCKNALMMKEQLIKANANIIGTVLTKINKTDYKSYYGSYNYYGTKKKDFGKWFKRFRIKRGKI